MGSAIRGGLLHSGMLVWNAAVQVNDTAECCQIDSTGHSDEDVVYALD